MGAGGVYKQQGEARRAQKKPGRTGWSIGPSRVLFDDGCHLRFGGVRACGDALERAVAKRSNSSSMTPKQGGCMGLPTIQWINQDGALRHERAGRAGVEGVERRLSRSACGTIDNLDPAGRLLLLGPSRGLVVCRWSSNDKRSIDDDLERGGREKRETGSRCTRASRPQQQPMAFSSSACDPSNPMQSIGRLVGNESNRSTPE